MLVVCKSNNYGQDSHVNNCIPPIAASLGDLTTLALLAWIAGELYADMDRDSWLAPTIIGVYVAVIIPISIYITRTNEMTKQVLLTGWTPVLIAMIISSMGGVILDTAVTKFKGIAVFQPVMNGVGGNLVAVQASRISTHLHTVSSLETGDLPPDEHGKICLNPCSVFFGGKSPHAMTAKILAFLVIPGQLIFTYSISFLQAGHTSPTLVFITFYILAAVIQIIVLLYTCHWLIHLMWSKKIDPDNSAIPYLTALGDLLGTGLLYLAFQFLYLIGDKDSDVGD